VVSPSFPEPFLSWHYWQALAFKMNPHVFLSVVHDPTPLVYPRRLLLMDTQALFLRPLCLLSLVPHDDVCINGSPKTGFLLSCLRPVLPCRLTVLPFRVLTQGTLPFCHVPPPPVRSLRFGYLVTSKSGTAFWFPLPCRLILGHLFHVRGQDVSDLPCFLPFKAPSYCCSCVRVFWKLDSGWSKLSCTR